MKKIELVEYPLEVWEKECEFMGSFRLGERYCKRRKEWVKKTQCLYGCDLGELDPTQKEGGESEV